MIHVLLQSLDGLTKEMAVDSTYAPPVIVMAVRKPIEIRDYDPRSPIAFETVNVRRYEYDCHRTNDGRMIYREVPDDETARLKKRIAELEGLLIGTLTVAPVKPPNVRPG